MIVELLSFVPSILLVEVFRRIRPRSQTVIERSKQEKRAPWSLALVVSIRGLRSVSIISAGLGLLHHRSRHRIWR